MATTTRVSWCFLVLIVVLMVVTSTLAGRTDLRQQQVSRKTSSKSAPSRTVYSNQPLQRRGGPQRNAGSDAQKQQKLSTRQIQQWQIAVNVPAGAVQPGAVGQGQQPPSAPAPGHIWIQVPVSYQPAQSESSSSSSSGGAPGGSSGGSQQPMVPPPAGNQEPAAPPPSSGGEAAPPSNEASGGAMPPFGEPTSENEDTGNGIEEMPPGSAIETDPEKLKHCQEPRGQFPNPEACNMFYNCWDGHVAEQSCPGELVFSDQGPFCDYPENVDCSQRGGAPPAAPAPAPAPENEGQSEPEVPAEGTEEGGDMSQGGEEEQGQQEGGAGGAGGSEEGDWQEGEEEPAVSPEEMAEDVGEGCKEPFSRYRSPKRCNVFIVCDNGNPVRFKCPDTLNYNEGLGVCDWPYRVNCGDSESTAGSEQQEIAPASESTSEADRKYYGGFANRPPLPARKVNPSRYRG